VNLLPGWFPAAAAAPVEDAGLTTLSQVLSATDNSGAAFTLPVGIQAGDLIVVWDVATGASLPFTALPTDFTPIANVTISTTRCILSYKIAVGGESGASVNGMDGSSGEAKAVYVFRGDIPITAVNVQSVNSQATDGNPTGQTVTASGGAAPLIVIGSYAVFTVGGTVNPRTFSPAKDGEISVTNFIGGFGGDMWLAYKIYNSSPADVSVDMDDEGDRNTLVSCYIECT
jgi:hypothetical protein